MGHVLYDFMLLKQRLYNTCPNTIDYKIIKLFFIGLQYNTLK